MATLPSGYRADRHPPFARRVYLPAFSGLNPLSLPWVDLRRTPENFPAYHVAKVSSARTVVGIDFQAGDSGADRIYLKRSLLRGTVNRLRARWGRSKEWREFQLALDFAKAGVNVPEPLYYAETRPEVEPAAIFFATRALPHPWRPAKEFFKERREFTGVWESLARYTRRLHDNGVLHGDYRSDHVFLSEEMLERGEEDGWALIDLDGSAVGRRVTKPQRRRALSQLTESFLTSGIDETALERFLRIYDPESRYRFGAAEILREVLAKAGGGAN